MKSLLPIRESHLVLLGIDKRSCHARFLGTKDRRSSWECLAVLRTILLPRLSRDNLGGRTFSRIAHGLH